MKVEVKSYTDKETGLTSNQALSHKKNTLEASVSKTYTKILSQHSVFNDLLYKMSRYNKVTKNPASSFVEIIKDNTKYRK